MVQHVAQGLQAGSSEDGFPPFAKPTAAAEAREKQKVIAFKVSHLLLSVFFLWLTYIPKVYV
jgi:hypothetical protein